MPIKDPSQKNYVISTHGIKFLHNCVDLVQTFPNKTLELFQNASELRKHRFVDVF